MRILPWIYILGTCKDADRRIQDFLIKSINGLGSQAKDSDRFPGRFPTSLLDLQVKW